MGVRRKQYGMELERGLGKGKTLMKAHKVSAMRSKAGSKADKFDRPSWADKLILGILRRGKKKPFTSQRSKDITSRLKRAGIDQKTIDRMKKKKKSAEAK